VSIIITKRQEQLKTLSFSFIIFKFHPGIMIIAILIISLRPVFKKGGARLKKGLI